MVSAIAPNGSTDRSGSRRPGGLSRQLRLLRHADFERVYKQGRRHFATHMTVFYLSGDRDASLRVGFTVGRVLGGAVERNRIKRRLREAVRLHRPLALKGVDVVINPKKSLRTADFAEIEGEIIRAFEVVQKTLATTR